MINYSDATVLVTGAASGIGEALASALSSRGARVICADRDVDGARETAVTIGNSALALEYDLSDPVAAAQLVRQSHAVSGRLDLICSNAGIGHRGSPIEVEMN